MAATLDDVARLAGVSRAAASRVLGSHSGKMDIAVATQERIRASAKKLNYVRDARAHLLRGATSPMLGVLVDGLERRLRPTLLNYLTKDLQTNGKEILLGVHERNIKVALEHIETFRAYRTFGTLTISGVDTVPDEVAETLRNGRGECGLWVAVFFTNRRSGVPAVTLDVRGVVAEFLQLAVADGRRHAIVAGKRDAAFDYCAAIFAGEAARHPEITGEIMQVAGGGPEQVAEELCPAIRERSGKGPAAVLTFEDSDAFAIVAQLCRMGVAVPDDVAVVGYGNWDIASLCDPPITTFDVAGTLPDMANKVLELINEVGAGTEPESIEYSFKPKLVVRKSFLPEGEFGG